MDLHIGKKIKILLTDRGLTQSDLAELLHKSPVYVHQIIKKDTLDISKLMEISRVLNVPVTYFLDDTDDNTPPIHLGEDKNAATHEKCSHCEEREHYIMLQKELITSLRQQIRLLEKQVSHKETVC